MHILFGALIGAVAGVVITVGVALVTKRKLRFRDVALAAGAGALAGVVTTATLGLGAGAATAGFGKTVAAFSAGGAVAAGSEQAAHNALDERPLLDGVGTSVLIGGAAGAGLPVVGKALSPVVRPLVSKVRTAWSARAPPKPPAVVETKVVVVQGKRGLSSVLSGDKKTGKLVRIVKTVHAKPPTWLTRRFDRTLRLVRQGRGPKASHAEVKAFLHETYEHVNEVNALIKALGGRARAIPTRSPGAGYLRGVHDFGERVSIRRVEQFIAELRRNPLKDADGVPLEVPHWLARLPSQARQAGHTTIDVSKLSPEVAAGLGRAGPPDIFAIKLHNLSPHHMAKIPPSPTGRPSNLLIESVADRINAMRQVRIYRPHPLPFRKIEQILLQEVERGALPPEARALITRALKVQARLERTGVVNPYHLHPAEPAVASGVGG